MCTNKQRGLTLIELVIFIVVVGIAIAGILGVMNLMTRHSADPLPQKQALAVAESLLEEIELKDFANPAGGFSGAATQANRPSFDDVRDYHNFASSGIYTIDGTLVPGLGSYSVAVAVVGAALGNIASSEAALITVAVTDPTGQAWTLSGYRSHYGQ